MNRFGPRPGMPDIERLQREMAEQVQSPQVAQFLERFGAERVDIVLRVSRHRIVGPPEMMYRPYNGVERTEGA